MRWLVDNDVFFAALYGKHAVHALARRWLDRAKPEGWAIAAETYLAAVRLLMNPGVMKSGHLAAQDAVRAVETELGGVHAGRVVLGRKRPDPGRLALALGHRQVMDLWLLQVAQERGCRIATNDSAFASRWPDFVEHIR